MKIKKTTIKPKSIMQRELWINGKLVESTGVELETPVSTINRDKYKDWADNYNKSNK